jgi:RIO kinase 1
MLARDVGNLRAFFGRFAPELLDTNYAGEIWSLYQAGVLTPASALTGRFEVEETEVDLEGVVREIGDAELEEAEKQLRIQG